jgi:hypothetical protein
MSLPNAVAITMSPRRFDAMSKWWAFVNMALLGLTIVTSYEGFRSPISCERAGGFGLGFSIDFDVVRTECRVSWMENSPVIAFYGESPYVTVSRPE